MLYWLKTSFPRIKISLLIAGLLFLTSHSSLASDAAALVQILNTTQSMTATFNHVMRDEEGEIVDESSGWVAWKRPENFRWEIEQPFSQTLVVKGSTLYQYDRDLNQLIVQSLSPSASAIPSILLSGDAKEIGAHYQVERIIAMPNQSADSGLASDPVLFKLSPVADRGLFNAILLEFNRGLLQAIDIEDDLQQTSRFQFNREENNIENTDALYHIEPGPDVDIIYQ